MVHSPDRILDYNSSCRAQRACQKSLHDLDPKGLEPIFYSVLFTAVAGRLKIMTLPFYDTQSKRSPCDCALVINVKCISHGNTYEKKETCSLN